VVSETEILTATDLPAVDIFEITVYLAVIFSDNLRHALIERLRFS